MPTVSLRNASLCSALGLPVLLFWQAVVPERAPAAASAAAAAGPAPAALLRSRAVWAIVVANMVRAAPHPAEAIAASPQPVSYTSLYQPLR